MFNKLINSESNKRVQPLFGQLSKIAKATIFIMRKRKVTDEGFFLCFLCFLKSIFGGNASFRQMASRLGRIDKISITKQGLWQRVDHTAIAFLLATLTTALGQRWKAVSKKQPGLADLFGRILTEDSTQHRFHMGNAKTFKAHGNRKSETVGLKVDLTSLLVKPDPRQCFDQHAGRAIH